MCKKEILAKELRCELCGEFFQNLTTHLIKIHEIDPENYKEQFDVSHVMSDRLRKKLADAFATKPRTPSNEYAPYSKEDCLEILKKLHEEYSDLTPSDLRVLHPTLYNQMDSIFGKVSTGFIEAGLYAKQHLKWDKQGIIKAILDRKKRKKCLSAKEVFDSSPNLWSAARRCLGSWEAAIEQAGLDYQSVLKIAQSISPEELEMQLREWVQKNGPLIAAEIKRTNSTLYLRMLRRFGSIEGTASALGLPFRKLADPWSKQKVLAEAKARQRDGLSLNTKIVRDEFHALYYNGIKLFGTWSQVLKHLCVDPSSQNSFKRLTTKDLVAEIKSWCARHGALNYSKLLQTDRLLARRITHRFGSLEEGARECGVLFQKRALRSGKTKKWTKELIIKEIKGLRDRKGISTTQPALYGAASRKFGSWKKALDASDRC